MKKGRHETGQYQDETEESSSPSSTSSQSQSQTDVQAGKTHDMVMAFEVSDTIREEELTPWTPDR